MVENADQNGDPDWLKNLPIRSEEIGFAPDELVKCPNCGKANAPNRTTCLYCGVPPAGVSGADRLEIRAIENWENGSNIVLLDAGGGEFEKAADLMADVAGSDREIFNAAFESGKEVPLVRVASAEQAEWVVQKLRELGIETAIVDDSVLQANLPPLRLRSIGFGSDQLNLGLFNVDEVYPIAADDLILIVAGTIVEGRKESVARRKLRGAKMLDEASSSSDEPIIDLYSKSDHLGWRIPARGFDFSCLGPGKSLLVGENMKKLIAKLVEFAPRARLSDDYASVMSLVEPVWPIEVRREGRILNRKDVSTVFMTNNTTQFTKYSRLQWRLLYEEKV
jgi:hypothetical protein